MILLNPDEKILIKTGRHSFVLYGKLGQILIFFIVAATVSVLLFLFVPEENPMRNFMILVFVLLLLFLWFWAFIIWLDYRLDVWIVTTERIIDIELQGLFQREVSEFKLSRIQDISVDIRGFLPTFFDFGDLHIQTAGAMRKFIFHQIPKPNETKKLILKAHDNYMVDRLTSRHDQGL